MFRSRGPFLRLRHPSTTNAMVADILTYLGACYLTCPGNTRDETADERASLDRSKILLLRATEGAGNTPAGFILY